MSMMQKGFYMIVKAVEDHELGENGHGNKTIPPNTSPRAIYRTVEDAKKSVQALLKKEPNASFIILKSHQVGQLENTPVIYTNLY